MRRNKKYLFQKTHFWNQNFQKKQYVAVIYVTYSLKSGTEYSWKQTTKSGFWQDFQNCSILPEKHVTGYLYQPRSGVGNPAILDFWHNPSLVGYQILPLEHMHDKLAVTGQLKMNQKAGNMARFPARLLKSCCFARTEQDIWISQGLVLETRHNSNTVSVSYNLFRKCIA